MKRLNATSMPVRASHFFAPCLPRANLCKCNFPLLHLNINSCVRWEIQFKLLTQYALGILNLQMFQFKIFPSTIDILSSGQNVLKTFAISSAVSRHMKMDIIRSR